jgi:Uma2 family endonuclease
LSRTLFPDAVITGEVLEHLRLPDVERYELVEGKIEALTPTNQFLAEATVRIAAVLLAKMPGWRILGGDPGVYTRRQPDTVRGPDVVALSPERNAQVDPRRAFLTVVPDLVVEIISPSNEDEDIARKTSEYVAGGAVVWVVNLDDATLAVHDRAGATVYRTGDVVVLPNGGDVTVDSLVRGDARR